MVYFNSSTEATQAGINEETAQLIYPSPEKSNRDRKILKAAKIVTIALAAIAFVTLSMAAIAFPLIMIGVAIPIVGVIVCSSVGGGALIGALVSGAILQSHANRMRREAEEREGKEKNLSLEDKTLAATAKVMQLKQMDLS